MNQKQGFFLGVSVPILSKKEILFRVRSSLAGNSFCRIATVGPEFLLRAREDQKFRENLLKADLRVADGFGITLAGWLSGRYIPRFPGVDLMHEILKEAEKRNLSVFLALRKDGLSLLGEIQTALLKKYPKLNLTGQEYEVGSWKLEVGGCEVVFCNFGAPDQEYFLEALHERPNGVNLAMGVGGAFDFFTGKLRRAPKLFRALGVEWLWRLVLQPSRWKRIWRAVVVFPVSVIKERFF